mmetsp:Transcript_4910/g.13705  ORF Transcript_4910/g.13705 Transcript_4910/m.13705 type:complete len:200 (-) Transcript_4910:2148-2747(-)
MLRVCKLKASTLQAGEHYGLLSQAGPCLRAAAAEPFCTAARSFQRLPLVARPRGRPPLRAHSVASSALPPRAYDLWLIFCQSVRLPEDHSGDLLLVPQLWPWRPQPPRRPPPQPAASPGAWTCSPRGLTTRGFSSSTLTPRLTSTSPTGPRVRFPRLSLAQLSVICPAKREDGRPVAGTGKGWSADPFCPCTAHACNRR